MSRGDPHVGLLKEIIRVMNELGADECWDSDHVTRILKERGQWKRGEARTPERTVNTYFNQNPHIFTKANENSFFLKEAYWTKPKQEQK